MAIPTTDKACCCVPLRHGCIGIAIFFLVSIVLSAITQPGNLSQRNYLIGFVILILQNAALLFGALQEKPWIVCVWLLLAIFFYIGWPLAVVGIIFNSGGYREASNFDNVFLILFEYIIILGVFSYCTYIVWSYFSHLRNRDDKPAKQRAIGV